MKYYPISLDVKNKKCLVVGGGEVGLRKTTTLLNCQACVTVVSRDFSEGFDRLEGNLSLQCREYQSADLEGMILVFGTTDNRQVNQRVKEDADQRNILCNIADDPDGSGFIVPSIVQRGDLVLTVSTSGASPAFSRHLKQNLEKQFDPYYADFLSLMGTLRQKLLMEKHAPKEHKRIFNTLIQKGLLEMVADNDFEKINLLLRQVTGLDVSYESLLETKG